MSSRDVLKNTTWLLCLLSAFTGIQTEVCPKFSGENQKIAEEVNGVCYYGFGNSKKWDAAASLCASENTHLVHLRTMAKQTKIYQALALTQHWTGLRYVSGTWTWYYNSSYSVNANDNNITARFPTGTTRGQGQTAAYTNTGGNQATLHPASSDWEYRPLCEDEAGSATTSTPATTTSTTPSTTTTTTTTTTPSTTSTSTSTSTTPLSTTSTTASSVISASADIAERRLFQKQTTLTNAQSLKQYPCSFRPTCALHCLRTTGCRHFVFQQSMGICEVFEESSYPGLSSPDCLSDMCYTMIA